MEWDADPERAGESSPRDTVLDLWGHAVTSPVPDAVRALDRAIIGLAAHRADTGAALEQAIALDPGLSLGHVVRGLALRTLGRADLVPEIRASLARARASLADRGGTPRERGLARALGAWCDGTPLDAVEELDRVLDAHPTCLLTVKVAQALQFILGRPAGMRASIERVLPAWREDSPGGGFVLGCHAFALEETGERARAERVGRRSFEVEPRDAWGFHAVLHVLMLEDRVRDGLSLAESRTERFRECNNFAGHVAWHHALFALALRRFDDVLALYDREIAVYPARDYRDMANCTSLLYRLEREGVDVGKRWEPLAVAAAARIGDHASPFADTHYALALAGARRLDAARELVESMRAACADRTGLDARVGREVGVPAAEAIVHLLAGDPGRAVERLEPVAGEIVRLGGSNAQRELFERVLLDAALDAGKAATAGALIDATLAVRPRCAWALDARARLSSPGSREPSSRSDVHAT